MKITWLGQAGLLFEHQGCCVMIDPYLSNACGEKNPSSQRRIPVDERMLALRPDVIVLTHEHLDHTDPQTLSHFLTPNAAVTVLAAPNAWEVVRGFGGPSNYVRFSAGTEWTHGPFRFCAVKAEHSDPTAIGVLIEAGGKRYYVTGDTLYHKAIFADLPDHIDTVFLPINGRGNNMNATDAVRFLERTGASWGVPLHYGMFDAISPECFQTEKRRILTVYEPFEDK